MFIAGVLMIRLAIFISSQRVSVQLAELNEVEADVTAAEAALTGRIRLAAPTVFGTKHLGPAINAFLESHPDIQFDIEFNDRQIDIIEEGIDLAVRIAKLSDSRMIARRPLSETP